MFWLLSFVMSIQAVKCCLSIDGDDARQSHLLALKADFYDDFTCSLFHLIYYRHSTAQNGCTVEFQFIILHFNIRLFYMIDGQGPPTLFQVSLEFFVQFSSLVKWFSRFVSHGITALLHRDVQTDCWSRRSAASPNHTGPPTSTVYWSKDNVCVLRNCCLSPTTYFLPMKRRDFFKLARFFDFRFENCSFKK